MAKSSRDAAQDRPPRPPRPSRKDYEDDLRALQIEMSKLQRWIEAQALRVCVVMEGRDAAGKDGSISRILAYLPPRRARMVALPKPTDREAVSWYFQRYAAHLPADGELVVFNRSWYNRAGVEPVMGFCTQEQHDRFMRDVPKFEELLADANIRLIKYYLDITKDEQAKRLAARREDPLKWWKISPIDVEAQNRWEAYSEHRDAMLRRTTHNEGPWHVVDANDKRLARLNLMRHLLSQFDYEGRDDDLATPDPRIAYAFTEDAIASGKLAK